MIRCTLALLSALALASPCLAAAGKASHSRITEAQARSIVAAMETAAKNRDARTVASYMSDDCVVTTSFPGKDGGKKVTRKDKRKYVADEAAASAASSDYVYETARPAIDIDASGKVAKASYKVRETYTEQGRKVQIVAYEIATVELRGGEPAITAMDVDAVAMTIDDRRIF